MILNFLLCHGYFSFSCFLVHNFDLLIYWFTDLLICWLIDLLTYWFTDLLLRTYVLRISLWISLWIIIFEIQLIHPKFENEWAVQIWGFGGLLGGLLYFAFLTCYFIRRLAWFFISDYGGDWLSTCLVIFITLLVGNYWLVRGNIDLIGGLLTCLENYWLVRENIDLIGFGD